MAALPFSVIASVGAFSSSERAFSTLEPVVGLCRVAGKSKRAAKLEAVTAVPMGAAIPCSNKAVNAVAN